MARFVRKPRPTHQQRRSHGHDRIEEAEVNEEVMSGEATAVAPGAAVDMTGPEPPSPPPRDEAPIEDGAEEVTVVVGPSAPEDEVAAEAEEATDTGEVVEEATAGGADAASVAEVVEAPTEEPVADESVTAETEVDETEVDETEVDETEVDETDASPDAAGADDGGAERRTIKRRRRRRTTTAGDTDAGDSAAGDTEAGDESGADDETLARADDPAGAGQGMQAKKATLDADDADRDERRRMQMLIHVEGDRVQVSVLEGRSLVEHYVADRTSQSLAGNIYLGKVQNVLPGMEAAFVDIGTPKNAVLYAGDVRFIADEFETKTPRIEDILEVGQSVLVQVVKDPMGSKGARLTTEISLPGRFLVLVPESDTTGISRRLAESERERLRDVLRRLRPDGFGVIVRTASEYTSEEKLALDMQRLEALWKEVYLEATRANPPELVYEEPDLVIRTVREIFSGEFRRLIVDDKEVYDKICAYLGDYEPDLLQRIQHYEDEMALYRRYHVSEQLRQGLSRKVWLPSGGSLVFDSAEALTVIDVNTSKNVGKNSLEETVFQNNLEAAEEIGRQLRLRDIGGIIVIDFIDMETAKNRQAVLRAFRESVGRDKTKTQVYDISELGLVEMTRKNVSEGLISAFSHACAECSGRGLIVDEDF